MMQSWILAEAAPLALIIWAVIPKSRRLPEVAVIFASLAVLNVGMTGAGVRILGLPQDLLGGLTDVLVLMGAWDAVKMWRGMGGGADGNVSDKMRGFYVGWALFWGALLAAALAVNLGWAWCAIAVSTVTSGWLVAFDGTPKSLRATWRYLLVTSVGLLLTLLGIVILYAEALRRGGGLGALDFRHLSLLMAALPVGVRELTVLLLIAGFATKAGLVPFHTWLPDAHAEAPAPVSALLSGLLLPMSLIMAARVANAAPIPDTFIVTGPHLLMWAGLASLLVGAAMMLVQRHVKRLLAYSSIEQVGIMAVGFAIGTPLAIGATILQIILHAVVKSLLFFTAGHLSEELDSKHLAQIRPLAVKHPGMSVVWGLGLLALAGIPPLPLYYPEWELVSASLTAGLGSWVPLLLIGGLVLAFAVLVHHVLRILWGGAARAAVPKTAGRWVTGALAVLAGLGLIGMGLPAVAGNPSMAAATKHIAAQVGATP